MFFQKCSYIAYIFNEIVSASMAIIYKSATLEGFSVETVARDENC
jgi:hypothetical protein